MNNRERLKLLLYENGITQVGAARLIEEITHRPCSARSVRTWVNNPDKPSSRACPDWVIDVLKIALLEKGYKP